MTSECFCLFVSVHATWKAEFDSVFSVCRVTPVISECSWPTSLKKHDTSPWRQVTSSSLWKKQTMETGKFLVSGERFSACSSSTLHFPGWSLVKALCIWNPWLSASQSARSNTVLFLNQGVSVCEVWIWHSEKAAHKQDKNNLIDVAIVTYPDDR